jgi:hypothetical protein
MRIVTFPSKNFSTTPTATVVVAGAAITSASITAAICNLLNKKPTPRPIFPEDGFCTNNVGVYPKYERGN